MYSAYKPGDYIVVDLKHMPTSIMGQSSSISVPALSTKKMVSPTLVLAHTPLYKILWLKESIEL